MGRHWVYRRYHRRSHAEGPEKDLRAFTHRWSSRRSVEWRGHRWSHRTFGIAAMSAKWSRVTFRLPTGPFADVGRARWSTSVTPHGSLRDAARRSLPAARSAFGS